MQRLTTSSVVDQLVSELAASRRGRMERNAAYVALAHAILADEPTEIETPHDFETQVAA
jgi:hypothetical protein